MESCTGPPLIDDTTTLPLLKGTLNSTADMPSPTHQNLTFSSLRDACEHLQRNVPSSYHTETAAEDADVPQIDPVSKELWW